MIDTARFQRVAELFAVVREADPSTRTATLDAACMGDTELRDEVLELIRHHESPSGWLDRPAITRFPELAALDAASSAPRAGMPDRIGRYRVIRVLGEGGMGVVYLAEQDRPKRIVALKVIRASSGSASAGRRLEHEAELLGRLQHPGIAQVLEAGVADVGGVPQPYFAMEYVNGPPLIDHASQARLSISQRLELLLLICDAVHHAHQRGVIHRDLKPGNILVIEAPEHSRHEQATSGAGTPVRAQGQPKVLDFGIARSTNSDVQMTTLRTSAGQILGTIPYMSPEQLAGDPTQIDIRCDVYALGVVGFELLTGRLPYDLHGKSIPEAARVIQEQTARTLAATNPALRGDLDIIMARALEKDRSRRYQSAADLAQDLRCYLAGEPIAARRDSMMYVLRRRLQRYRWSVAAAACFAIMLSAFAVYAGAQARIQSRLVVDERRATRAAQLAQTAALEAKHLADRERNEARRAGESERRQRTLAEQEAVRAVAMTEFLVDMLGLADPDLTQVPDMNIRVMLDRASADVGRSFAHQPESEAAIRTVVGRAYFALGELEASRDHLTRALELRRAEADSAPEDIYEILLPLRFILADLQDFNARSRSSEATNLAIEIIAGTDPELAAAWRFFGAQVKADLDQQAADTALEEAMGLGARSLRPDDPMWLYVGDLLFAYGSQLGSERHYEPACRYIQESLDIHRRLLPETHTRVSKALYRLVTLTIRDGRYVDAEALIREAVDQLERVLPSNHWYIGTQLMHLTDCRRGQGRFDEAEALYLDCKSRFESQLPAGNPYLIATLRRGIMLYEDWDRPADCADARAAFALALAQAPTTMTAERVEPSFGPEFIEVVDTYRALRSEIVTASAAAEAAMDRFVQVRRRLLRDDHVLAALMANILTVRGMLMIRRGGPDDLALRLLQESYRIESSADFNHARKEASTCWWLSMAHLKRGEFRESERFAREAVHKLERGPTERWGFTGAALSLLAAALGGQNRWPEAAEAALAGYEDLLDHNGPLNADTIVALDRVIEAMARLDQPAEAAHYVALRLEQALSRDEAAASLNNAASWVIRQRGLWPETYALALEVAECAADKEPENGAIQVTLGAALFRAGRYEEALASLERGSLLVGDGGPIDCAFMALTSHALGDDHAADRARHRLHDRMRDPDHASVVSLVGLQNEVEQALMGVEFE